MASPGNIRFDHLQVPDGYDWTIEDLNYSQFVPLAYQLSTPILAEPSMASAGPLRYTHPIQYPIASVAPGFPVSTSLHSTCSDLCRFKQNVIHQSPINNDCAAMAPAPGYLDPNHGVACTTLPVSTWSPQKGSQVKATSDSYTKGKRAYGRSRGRQQKQE
ncbi:hypothetical protein N7517_001529 [Penicillium concentricum]|uniref:Uncharacterized protein n=1 Tax=Penicillium concentricum TaxID=293559 RepID=A0A9W9VIL9_9EURO|nr:uncharacterized protein N7517_001529 [Penicillium concentricum]KAJ5383618.1 hypothetical protein N7517_001529 [Penicillium concentricum]